MRRALAAMCAVIFIIGFANLSSVSAASGTAGVVVVHGVPGVIVDVYVDGDRLLDDFAPSTVSPSVQVGSGVRTVAITAGDAVDDSAPITSSEVTFVPGADMSVVAHLDGAGAVALSSFLNNTAAPAAGSGRVTVRHLAAAPAVDVLVDGAVAFSGVANGRSASADLPAKSYGVSLNAAGTATQAFPASGVATVPVNANANIVVYAVGDLGATTFELLTQSIDAPGTPATVHVVHGIPGVSVDVYIDGRQVLAGFEAGDIAGPLLVPPGTRDIEVFAAGSPYVAGAGVLTATDFAVVAGADVSLVAHLDNEATPAPVLTAFVDDLSVIPDGRVDLNVRHVAAAPAVDVLNGTEVLLDGITLLQDAVAEGDAGTYPLRVNLDSDNSLVADLGDIALEAGTKTVVYAYGSAEAATLAFAVQVTPGLAAGGAFPDAGVGFYVNDVRTMYQLGITRGSAGLYEPDREVTRGEMAAFINRTLELPASSVDAFADDNGNPFEADINALAAAGITKGTSATTYSPASPVNRAEMAAFLVRAFSVPASDVDAFGDDDGSLEPEINALAAAGITRGTTATTFAPTEAVSRGQMASFLARSLGLG